MRRAQSRCLVGKVTFQLMALKIKGKQGRKCLLPAAPATPCCIPGLMRSVCATAKHQLSKSQSVSHNWGFHLQPLLSTVNASAAGRGAGMGAGAVPLEGVYSDNIPFLRFAFSCGAEFRARLLLLFLGGHSGHPGCAPSWKLGVFRGDLNCSSAHEDQLSLWDLAGWILSPGREPGLQTSTKAPELLTSHSLNPWGSSSP